MLNNGDRGKEMVFGFDRDTDERSLRSFIKRIAGPEMLDELMPRLSSQEIESVVDLFTGLMKRHLSEKKYHRLFLGDE
jgi:hypothetical protein